MIMMSTTLLMGHPHENVQLPFHHSETLSCAGVVPTKPTSANSGCPAVPQPMGKPDRW